MFAPTEGAGKSRMGRRSADSGRNQQAAYLHAWGYRASWVRATVLWRSRWRLSRLSRAGLSCRRLGWSTGCCSLLADDLHFEGPIDKFTRADDYVKAITGLYGMIKGVQHQATIAQREDVAVFYLLDTPMAKTPVAEWYTVRDSKIVHIRTYFDARPFAPPPHS